MGQPLWRRKCILTQRGKRSYQKQFDTKVINHNQSIQALYAYFNAFSYTLTGWKRWYLELCDAKANNLQLIKNMICFLESVF